MSKVALSKNSKFKNGFFKPTNPHKYVGDVNNIIYRSSWERRVCVWFDKNPSVVCWNSESLVIPYFDIGDKKMHNYHTDFVAKMLSRDGTYKTYVIEVKPEKETLPPKTKNQKKLLREVPIYVKNQCKWAAAEAYCKSKGAIFIIITEYDLGIKQRVKK